MPICIEIDYSLSFSNCGVFVVDKLVTDGRTDGRTDRRTDGWTDKGMKELVENIRVMSV